MQLYIFCSQRAVTQFKPGWVSFAMKKKVKTSPKGNTRCELTMATYVMSGHDVNGHPAGRSLVARIRCCRNIKQHPVINLLHLDSLPPKSS